MPANDGEFTIIKGLKDIVDQYDLFILDVWGVVHDGERAYPGVVDAIHQLLKVNKEVIFLSNAPRPQAVVAKKLKELGIAIDQALVITSGDVIRDQLQHWSDAVFKTLGRRLYHLGASRNQDILAGLDVQVVNSLASADFVLLSAYLDEGEDLSQYDAFFEEGVALKKPLICANADRVIVNGPKNRYCAGFFADRYQTFGGQAFYYGKPHQNVYDFLMTKVRHQNKERMIMVGDTPDTDLLGANRFNIDSLLVQTGNMLNLYKAHEEQNSGDHAAVLEKILKNHGVTASKVIAGLSW